MFLARSDLLNRLGPDLCPVDEEIPPRLMKSWRTFAPHRAGSGMRSPKSPTPFIRCPAGMHKIGLFLLHFYAMFIYWQFVTLSIG